mmetsp:Transcript_6307/g.9176  ORF Transcript_6307/g.9176 Transcript_6307/m.9176 type:complete len:897 (+) Transcript_6307:150-2840(+)
MSSKNSSDEDYQLSTSTMKALSKEFQVVQNELSGNDYLDRFRTEYEKLFKSYKRSQVNEKRLIKKCSELESEILSFSQKVLAELKSQSEDQNEIFKLKKSIEEKWKEVDQLNNSTSDAKVKMRELKKEIDFLNQALESAIEGGQSESNTILLSLKKEKEKVFKEHEVQHRHLLNILNEIKRLHAQHKALEKESKEKTEKCKELKQRIEDIHREVDDKNQEKNECENKLVDLKIVLDNQHEAFVNEKSVYDEKVEELKNEKRKLKEQHERLDKSRKRVKLSQTKLKKMEAEVQQRIESNNTTKNKRTDLEDSIEETENMIDSVNDQIARSTQRNQQLAALVQKAQKQQEAKEKMRIDQAKLVNEQKAALQQLRRELDQLNNEFETKKNHEATLEKNKQKLKSQLKNGEDHLALLNGEKRSLSRLLFAYREQAEKQRKTLYALEKQSETYEAAKQAAESKYLRAKEELNIRLNESSQLKTMIEDGEDKRKKQQQLYEVTEQERNNLSKKYLDTRYEIDNLNSRMKNMNTQINTLKEELINLDKKIAGKQRELHEATHDKIKLGAKIKQVTGLIEQRRDQQKQNKIEIEKINQIIRQADKEKHQQRKELDNVVNDRDILGAQLIKRNDELADLYEKIKIQQSDLNRGAAEYRNVESQIHIIQSRMLLLAKKRDQLKPQVDSIKEVQTQVNRLQKTLLREKCKIKALSEEMQYPMNVHRYRDLEGLDPQRYELIMKLDTYQKRLIAKNEEIVKKDLLIQQKEKLYNELKNILNKQPGAEVADQLRIYQHSLKKKKVEQKSHKIELKRTREKVREKEEQSRELSQELENIRKEYFKFKRDERREMANAITLDDLNNFDLGAGQFSTNLMDETDATYQIDSQQGTQQFQMDENIMTGEVYHE